MVDITKEEFWDNKYEATTRKEKAKSKLNEFVVKYKIVVVLLISFGILMTINTILIYNFFKILTEM